MVIFKKCFCLQRKLASQITIKFGQAVPLLMTHIHLHTRLHMHRQADRVVDTKEETGYKNMKVAELAWLAAGSASLQVWHNLVSQAVFWQL